MNTKCLDNLNWFIEKSKRDKWNLAYEEDVELNVFGIVEFDKSFNGYRFIPVLHGGSNVCGVVVKT